MIHFVGFRGDEYTRAIRVFGPPDFIHPRWDPRSRREIADDDVVVIANNAKPTQYNAPDLIEE